MNKAATTRIWLLHFCVILLFAVLQFVLPPYHHGVFARVLVLAVFAMGYNLLFGYAGLLSLGHAMFFAAGLYGAGLTMLHLGWGVPAGFAGGVVAGAALSLIVGLLTLRTTGVAFMIVTLMFAQVLYLTIIYSSGWTMGDQGFALAQGVRAVMLGGMRLDLTDPATRYWAALALFSIALLISLVIARSRHGRVLVAIRENEERTSMLGYNTFANKLTAVVASGTISAAAGAGYAVLFGSVGANFANVQFSILPLLWVLTGGAATTLGPVIGTLFMYYAVDIASGFTSAWLLIVGLALILLVLFFPRGILGTVRARWVGWLP
ncbi:branched-chain amino acid ABC transporter permease [Mesorhizobium sp. BAC0120]|uniref:branched-chain amino acid ABC transporter permease n=1 Tax=Mesorhizobium sp. BAC0120 TaxID=3090670 RepID=UPI00298C2328|nr:branched-chain amino acid ABC transporter permease [Mesorhizobium sp. BAC0120]MDW6026494.1 branched-chain amino acid ABC transporter permease [Mesorhizobium sp. BAC0120]